MELLGWVFYTLRTFFTAFPVGIALSLGIPIFLLSLIRLRPIITLPTRSPRSTLIGFGIAGPIVILVVATLSDYFIMLDSIMLTNAWWLRALPLTATTIVVLAAAIALHRRPLPIPGERAISPRRRWWAFAPRTALIITITITALLFLTTAWHTVIGVSMPAGANRYGVGPENDGLPGFMRMQGDMGYVWGAGWPNHLATLLALATAVLAVIFVLAADATRPVFARASASDVREERKATAGALLLVTLGGLLLTLGAVWAHVGFVGTIIVGIPEDAREADFFVGTGYSDFAELIHKGGYVAQGIGAALLLRITFDNVRAAIATRANKQHQPDADAVALTSEASR